MLRVFPILLVLQTGFIPVTARIWVTMYPSSQKVMEGQPAVFTCISTSSITNVVWKVLPKGREVNPERDALLVTEVSDSVSVLRIDAADPRKHRRKFECDVSAVDVTGRTQTHAAEATLKVTRRSAPLHANFPRISSASKNIGENEGKRFADIVCSSAADESPERPEWLWIKDNTTHLGLPGRIPSSKLAFSRDRSKLTITNFGSSDAGTYTCVASNRRGTMYSQPIVLENPGDTSSSCRDRDGSPVPDGRDFHPADDTCVTCTCMRGAARGCRSTGCTTPQPDAECAAYHFVKSRDKCCNFECIMPIVEDSRHTCKDRDGNAVAEGESYMPDQDPCVSCTCRRGALRTCTSFGCETPHPDAECDEYESAPSRDQCCNFVCKRERKQAVRPCTDMNDVTVNHGASYRPDSDPCVSCKCWNGQPMGCLSVSCAPPTDDPTCDQYEHVRSRDICCKYRCTRTKMTEFTHTNYTGSSNTCTDRDGNAVTHGGNFKPRADPCVTCSCRNGREIGCVSIGCSPPDRDVTCDRYVAAPSRDTCCNFQCTRPRAVDRTERITDSSNSCRDRDGNSVNHGDKFKPRPDPCRTCTCWNRYSIFCVSVACSPPGPDELCDVYEAVSSRDNCCSFTCTRPRRPRISGEGGAMDTVTDYPLYCKDRQNGTVQNGEVFHPESDPCVICRCVKGRPKLCSTIECPEPGCEYYERVPDTCCEFRCLDTPEVQVPGMTTRVYIQQVGATAAIIQWEVANEDGTAIPDGSISVAWRGTDATWRTAYSGTHTQSVLLRDLDPNVRYQVMVTGTEGTQTIFRTEPEPFTLYGRVGNLLHLGSARADILQAKSLYPNDFERLADTDGMYLSLASFHETRMTVEQARDCPTGECGVVRFYMYKDDGYKSHYFSLMFTDIKDFYWAKAHL